MSEIINYKDIIALKDTIYELIDETKVYVQSLSKKRVKNIFSLHQSVTALLDKQISIVAKLCKLPYFKSQTNTSSEFILADLQIMARALAKKGFSILGFDKNLDQNNDLILNAVPEDSK